jgi:cation diffusion facilitator family transporter
MALLADGLHMASHAAALGIAFLAYVAARRYATDERFSFGTGKLNSLAGFASAVLLLGFALIMVTESTTRFINPVAISYDQALLVAVLGLLVNGLSAWILAAMPHDHDHAHEHEHHHDHNLRAAYLHVLADALTSILAIIALLAAKYYGANWMDPMMGIVGAVLVARWSYGLICDSARVLLDRQANASLIDALRASIEREASNRVTDLHCWSVGRRVRSINVFADTATNSTRPGSSTGRSRARCSNASWAAATCTMVLRASTAIGVDTITCWPTRARPVTSARAVIRSGCSPMGNGISPAGPTPPGLKLRPCPSRITLSRISPERCPALTFVGTTE